MSDLTPNQLPLQPFSEDKRPLPEIVADGNPDPDTGWSAFPLAYRDVDGKRYYAIQDWIRGIAQINDTKAASKFLNNIKRRFQKAGIQSSPRQRTLPYRASDGKTYSRDFADAEGLYGITQRMDANTGLRNRILDYLAAAGVKLDNYRIEADEPIDELPTDLDKALEAVINGYRRMGKSDRWIGARMQSTVQRKQFTEAFQKSLHMNPSSFQFAEITNDLQRGLWRRPTKQLRAEMGLAEGINLRDHMTEVGLNFETLGESIAEAKLKQTDNLNFEQAEDIVYNSGQLLRPRADDVSKWLGIDIPTGRPLLPGNMT